MDWNALEEKTINRVRDVKKSFENCKSPLSKKILEMDSQDCYQIFGISNDNINGLEWLIHIVNMCFISEKRELYIERKENYSMSCPEFPDPIYSYRVIQGDSDGNHPLKENQLIEIIDALKEKTKYGEKYGKEINISLDEFGDKWPPSDHPVNIYSEKVIKVENLLKEAYKRSPAE